MTPQSIHIQAIELVLSSIYPNGDTSLVKFLYGEPGTPAWAATYRAEIFVRRKEYLAATLFVRKNGAAYLRTISISDLRKMVTDFLQTNYWGIREISLTGQLDESYAQQVDPNVKLALASALAISPLFQPTEELSLYPLLPIRVAESFETDRFFFLSAAELSKKKLSISAENFDPTQFPPCGSLDWKRSPGVKSWLGVFSPLPLVSKKLASAILGAVALTPIPRERHLFSGRSNFGGRCTIRQESYEISGNRSALVPAMANDIVLSKADHGWLQLLVKVLDSNEKEARSQQRALEYFYRAWSLNPRERFPSLCMSLDSLVAVEHGHTKAEVAYVKRYVDPVIDEERLKLLLRIRGAVIHGAAPDVYESENYENYYVAYDADPIRDLELIVAKCLRESIFMGTLKYHADPNAELISSLRTQGKAPARFDEGCIIAEDI